MSCHRAPQTRSLLPNDCFSVTAKKKKKKKEAGESIIEWTMIEETVDVKTGSPH